VNVLRFDYVLPFWTPQNDTGKASNPDTHAFYRGFSNTASCGSLVDSDGTDNFNPPYFQNMGTAEANASQKKITSKYYNQLNSRP